MTWTNGWWSKARKSPLHPARMGGMIYPFSTVVHSTAMHPDSWDDLLRGWERNPAKGNAATFGIGFSETVQWAPFHRNTNHAGGPSHGVYQVGKNTMHPNLVATGIEVHNAGVLRLVDGAWRSGGSPGPGMPWKPSGRAYRADEVVPDPDREDRALHKPTSYQLDSLAELLAALNEVLQPVPPDTVVKARGKTKPPAWATPVSPRVVAHASLDPDRRSDPHQLIFDHVNKI